MNRHIIRPRTVAEATTALAEVKARDGHALIVGGGTIAIPQLTRQEVQPTDIVDLGDLDVPRIWRDESAVHLGPAATYQSLIDTPYAERRTPLLHLMAKGITGGIQIRSQGTIAGSLVCARPYSDAPAVLVAHAAHVTVASAHGTRTMPAERFLTAPERPDLRPTELVTEIILPHRPEAVAHGYYKLKFAESSWPVVTCACTVLADGTAELTLGGVRGVPWKIRVSSGVSNSPQELRDVIDDHVSALTEDDFWQDIRADSSYRRRVAATVAARALRQAAARLPSSGTEQS
ncbi:FAD binding domain-containing protein [Streptomyces malaysiensis]|uniref:Carbon monoxide dehydrogenase medium chain n=1 Tax=Streptomyces malaysiensis TaxID=92644 RepID=A0A7X5X9T1_STRMQ|nr:FAD binding domain-containing protein [Streptomyces malaysiensis]NIY69270.1 carbon monoxide dehydrogenase medium chain [Streptomyces malaysiensis]